SSHNLAIAEDWRARVTDSRADLVELDILALHQSHAASGTGGHAALAHDIAWLYVATNTTCSHAVVGIGNFSIRAKFDNGVIQSCVLRHHRAGGADLPGISRSYRVAYFRAVASSHADFAVFCIGTSHRQSTHGLVIDVDRRTGTIQGLTLGHSLVGFFWHTRCIKERTRCTVQDEVFKRLASGYLRKQIVAPYL